MEVVYHPDTHIPEDALKAVLLFWGKARTLMPPAMAQAHNDYLAGEAGGSFYDIADVYKKVNDAAGSQGAA